MAGFLLFVLLIVAVIAFVQIASANRRIALLEQNVIWLRASVESLTRALRDTRDSIKQAPAAEAEPAPEASQPAAAAPVEVAQPGIIEPPAASPAAEEAAIGVEEPTFEAAEEPAEEAVEVPAAAFVAEEAPAEEPGQPPFTPPPTSTFPPTTPRSFDWEGIVGVKLFSWIAGFALVLAAVFFLRYSVQQGWLSPAVRATIGLLTGTALIVICELRIARGYAMTANAMHGAAIAILYATLFATYALWHLLSPAVVFPLMIVVTAVAVLLSIRRDSVFIALLGLVGGFSTPALLSTGENRPVGLFSYLLLLNVGLALVGYRKRWPLLTLFSIGFTVVYEWGWIAKFLTPSQMPLAAGIFVLFAIVAATALWIGRGDDGNQKTFDAGATIASALPLLFALYGAAVPQYGARYNLLFGFLLLMVAGLAAIAFTRGPALLHVLGAATAVIVFAIWMAMSWSASAWPAVVGWIAVFVVFYLGVELWRESDGVLAAPALFFMFPALLAVDATKGAPGLIFAAVFALLAAIAAVAIHRQRGAVYYIAAFFTIVAETVWSAKYLDAGHLLQGLGIYGIFALFFLGVPIVAKRLRRRLAPRGALALLLLVSIGVLFFLTGDTIADTALWGLAILLVILNLGALMEARENSQPVLAAIAMILSWIVIATWWSSATITASLVPALFVVGLFSVLVVAGNVWASRGAESAGEFENGVYIAMVGHVFLAFVATRSALALPPWPLFAILGVLDLALGIAAIYVRRARLMTAAMIASQAVILIWSTVAADGAWLVTSLVTTIVIAAAGIVWFAIDRRFTESAIAGLLGAYVVAIAAGADATKPDFSALLIAQVVITIAILTIAWLSEIHLLAVVATVAAALATELSQVTAPTRFFAFGFVLYALFIAYPLLLGRRAKNATEPYLAAVLASLWFFFVARHSIVGAGHQNIIGILPIAEALVLLALVLRLVRMDPPAERQLSRLALVAGAALAFITAAVPLQLEKQWITIAWALEGAALVWLYRRIPHRGLLLWAAGLLAAVFIRLSLNPAVLNYHAPSHIAVLNWFLYTYALAAAAMFVAARLAPRDIRYGSAAGYTGGTILLFLLLNIEIADFYSRGPTLTFNFFSSSLAQDLTYTIGWALFAIAMLVAGILTATRPARIAAVALLLVTILKCFLHDLARLGGLYRVGSLLGLALSLVVAGVLIQKFVMKPKGEASA